MDRMLANTKALYTDMTWGAGGSTADLSLQLAIHAHKTGHVCKYDNNDQVDNEHFKSDVFVVSIFSNQ